MAQGFKAFPIATTPGNELHAEIGKGALWVVGAPTSTCLVNTDQGQIQLQPGMGLLPVEGVVVRSAVAVGAAVTLCIQSDRIGAK